MKRAVLTVCLIAALGCCPAAAQETVRPAKVRVVHDPIEPPPPRPPKPKPKPIKPGPTPALVGFAPFDKLAPQSGFASAEPSWTGFYAGGSLAASWGRISQLAFDTTSVFMGGSSTSAAGVLGGAFAGAAIQHGSVVFGVEADAEARLLQSVDARLAIPAAGLPVFTSAGGNWRGSLRARAGYAYDPFLFYVTGGAAVSAWSAHLNLAAIGVQDSVSATRLGWTLGTGVEYRLGRNWLGRLEFRHTDFGGITYVFTAAPGTTYTDRLRDNTLRIGGAYRFD